MPREIPPEQAPRRNRYIQWSQFDTGRPYELVQGEDFDSTPRMKAHALRSWAHNHRRQVGVDVLEDRIRFVIYPLEADRLRSAPHGGTQ
jgi:hypothetical protein